MYKTVKNPCKKCGSFTRYISNGHCIECSKIKQKLQGNIYSKKSYLKNSQKNSEKRKIDYRNNDKRYKYMMLKRAEKRALEKDVPFKLTMDDIDIPIYCPILKVKLEIGKTSGPDDFSPSLDRIIPELGYVPGNVKIISMRANRIKTNATIEDIKNVLLYLKEHYS
jgi:hypothetical protein